jgi:hypothetical protein
MNRKQALRGLLVSTTAVALTIGVLMSGCTLPIVVSDDAGNASFTRQAVPILHGRKIRGYDEVKLLSDLAVLTNRQTVLRALMQQPHSIDHWAEVLVDALRVHREGSQEQTSCYGAPLRSGPDSSALADWVRTHTPSSSAPGGTFNMSDVLRSSLKLDNLYPAYTAHLFAMANRPGSGPEEDRRNRLGGTFGQVYVHRNMACLACHNSEYSLSGEASGWDRTHPIPGYFERALYGDPAGEPTEDAFAMFRSDVLGGSLVPWGIQNCGTFKPTVPNDPLGETAHFIDSQGMQFTIRGVQQLFRQGYDGLEADGLQRTLDPSVQASCDFCALNCAGSTLDIATVANSAPNAATVKTLLTNTVWSGSVKCIDCHGGSAGLDLTTGNDWANDLIGVDSSQPSPLKRVEPGNANNSYLIRKLENGPGIVGNQMPQFADPLSPAQINQIEAWINGMPALTACGVCATLACNEPKRYVDGREAFAFLTAANITDKVWAETMGGPLTIANYFPRNTSQFIALRGLTEYRFIPNDWSLQTLLIDALSSNYFNRKAPKFTATPSAYVIPPLLDPWIEADPRVPPVSDPGYVAANHPENHKNAMGEGVYRYAVRSLLHSIHKALDWPAPQRFPGTTGYANKDFQKAIGQYFTDTEPGFKGVDLQGLLRWEAVHGACVKPAGVSTDWIDRVVTATTAFNAANPGAPLTVADLVVVVRDWLLGHGEIVATTPVDLSGSEQQALASYFGVAALSDLASGVADLTDKLRGLCGVLVETPQFMLAGVTPSGLGPKPRLRVCHGTPCSYQDLCQELKPAIEAQLASGEFLVCGEDSVNIITKPRVPDWWVDFCFGPHCGLLIEFIPKGCDIRTALSCPSQPPLCDPRKGPIDGCGGPLPPLDKRRNALALAWAENAEVRVAEGVQVKRGGADQFVPLKARDRMNAGDLLALPPGSRFEMRNREGGIFKTPKEGVPKEAGTVFMQITGESVLRRQPLQAAEGMQKLPLEQINIIRNSAWQRRGEAGLPLSEKTFKEYKYPEVEQALEERKKAQ